AVVDRRAREREPVGRRVLRLGRGLHLPEATRGRGGAPSVSEPDPEPARRLEERVLWIDGPVDGDRLLDRDRDHVLAPVGGHVTELAPRDHLDGVDSELAAEDPVEGRGRAASLEVAEDREARLDAREAL